MSSSFSAVQPPPDLPAPRAVVYQPVLPDDEPAQTSFWSRVSSVFNVPNLVRALKVVPLGALTIATGAGTLAGAVVAGIQLAQAGVGGVLVAGPTCALLGAAGGGVSGSVAVATMVAARRGSDDGQTEAAILLAIVGMKGVCVGAAACAVGGGLGSILAYALA